MCRPLEVPPWVAHAHTHVHTCSHVCSLSLPCLAFCPSCALDSCCASRVPSLLIPPSHQLNACFGRTAAAMALELEPRASARCVRLRLRGRSAACSPGLGVRRCEQTALRKGDQVAQPMRRPPPCSDHGADTTCPAMPPAALAPPPHTVPTAAPAKDGAVVAMPKPSGSKFVPLENIPPAPAPTPVVPGEVPEGASILIIQQPWIDLILDGRKTLEIRGRICKKEVRRTPTSPARPARAPPLADRLLPASAARSPVSESSWPSPAAVASCWAQPSSPAASRWAARSSTWRAHEHCVAGSTLPYGSSTYGWGVRAPVRFAQPVRYHHKPGVVVWAKMEGRGAAAALA